MRRLIAALSAVLVIGALVPQALAQEVDRTTSGTTYVDVTADAVTIGNALVERSWSRAGWATTSFVDKRTGEGVTRGAAPDFTLDIATGSVPSDVLQATNVSVTEIPGGLRADVTLAPAAGTEPAFTATRTIEIYDGIA